MGIIARNPSKPRWHVLWTDQKNDVDTKDEDKFAFEYKMLSMEREAQLRDELIQISGMGDDRSEKYRMGKQDLDLIKTNVVGWRNLKDDEGNEIQFSGSKDLDMLDAKIREEMVRVIRGEDPLSQQRAKEMKINLD